MILTATDSNYINCRLEECGFKYQEIYDEIKDHLILATEAARKSGDERNIEYVFDGIMNTQFPGYYVFEKIAIQYERAYRVKMRKAIWVNFKYYLDLKNCLLMALLFIAGFYLPQSKVIDIALTGCLLIVAVFTIFYVDAKVKRIQTDNGKRSIIRDYIKICASVLIFANAGLYSWVSFANGHIIFTGPSNYGFSSQLLLISFAVIYGLSIISLCRQELNIFDDPGLKPQ